MHREMCVVFSLSGEFSVYVCCLWFVDKNCLLRSRVSLSLVGSEGAARS